MADVTDTGGEAAPSKGEWFRGVVFQYLGSMFMEANGGGRYVVSLGRVALIAILAQAMWQWRALDRDIVPGLKETLFYLLAYNFGSKGLGLVKDALGVWQAKPAAGEPTPPTAAP